MRLSCPGRGKQALAEPPTVERSSGRPLTIWLRRHPDTHLESLSRHARPGATAVPRRTLHRLSSTAATAGGLRTVRPDHGHTAVHTAGAGAGDRRRGWWA